MNSGLVGDTCVLKLFGVNQHKIQIFDSKAYDLSKFSSLELSNEYTRYTFHFWNTVLRPYVYVEGNLGESTGILELVFTQNPKIYYESLAILALDNILALIGGYMNVVILLLSQLTVYMHFFNMDMSLIKQMYTVDGRDQASEGTFNQPKELLKHRLDMRMPFFWSFKGYISARWVTCLCCCFKKR